MVVEPGRFEDRGKVRLFARRDGRKIDVTDIGTGEVIETIDNDPDFPRTLIRIDQITFDRLTSVIHDASPLVATTTVPHVGKTRPRNPALRRASDDLDDRLFEHWRKERQACAKKALMVKRVIADLRAVSGRGLSEASHDDAILLRDHYRKTLEESGVHGYLKWLRIVVKASAGMSFAIGNNFDNILSSRKKNRQKPVFPTYQC